jgi:hypothetical protein
MDRTLESLRQYLARLAAAAYRMADDEGRTDPDELEEHGLDIDSVATEYWISESRWLFAAALYLLEDSVRKSKQVRALTEQASQVFSAAFAGDELPDVENVDSFLAAGTVWTGAEDIPSPATYSEETQERAERDGLVQLL